ncbi:protein DBF4 homolog B isoform X2 [Carettochelys insculpta]|uniref:protein DBF4 homolog B isoform X2 n=1 Tax=Carettochelys insculpta TaxID=44489 RepID=UPI003EBAD7C4
MGCHAAESPHKPPPFLGKSFYLDVPSGRSARLLAATIRQLGGVVESFLCKEVSYVVSSSKEAKLDSEPGRQTEKKHSAASGDAKAQTLPSAVPKGSHAGPRHKPADSALISRGKELLQKAMRNQDSSSGSSILANARSWGVQILHVDEMMAYVQQLLFRMSGARKKNEKMTVKSLSMGPGVLKVRKLKPPFLKIEDESRKFRPFHHQFKSFPDLNFLAPNRSSPFEPLKSSDRHRAPEGCLTHSEREESPQSHPAVVPKRRKGYCECCQESFGELQMHLQSPRHRQFALDASQYAAVDQVISQLTNDFAELSSWSSTPRAPCSPAAEEYGSRAKPMASVGVPAAAKAELRLHPVAGLGMPAGECSAGPEEGQKEKASEHLLDPEWPAGQPLLGLWAEQPPRPRPAGRHQAWCWNTAHSAALATAAHLSPCSHASNGVSAEAAACSPEHALQDVFEAPGRPLGTSPCSRKRKPSDSCPPQLAKKLRIRLSSDPLYLEKRSGSVRYSSVQGVGLAAGGAAATAPSGAPGAQRLLPSSRLCCFPASVTPQDSGHVLPEPVPLITDNPQVALASPAAQQGWNTGTTGLQEGQCTEKALEPSCCAPGQGLELQSPTWDKASCPAVCPALSRLPVSQPRHCCCSPYLCLAEGALPEPPSTTALGQSTASHPSSPTGPNLGPSPPSSESDWDVQLPCSLDALQRTKNKPVDLEVLQRTCVNVRDSTYESRLYSVLKQKSEWDWAGRDDQSCWNCRAETEGAPFPLFEACLGSWTS